MQSLHQQHDVLHRLVLTPILQPVCRSVCENGVQEAGEKERGGESEQEEWDLSARLHHSDSRIFADDYTERE